MTIVLDASMALAWHFHRSDPSEELIARQALVQIEMHGAVVPALWYAEVANALLVAERRGVSTHQLTASFLADLAQMPIDLDIAPPSSPPRAARFNRPALERDWLRRHILGTRASNQRSPRHVRSQTCRRCSNGGRQCLRRSSLTHHNGLHFLASHAHRPPDSGWPREPIEVSLRL